MDIILNHDNRLMGDLAVLFFFYESVMVCFEQLLHLTIHQSDLFYLNVNIMLYLFPHLKSKEF